LARAQASIVVPVHDHAGLTRQCVDAVLAAPTRTQYELIVVDDASTDSTPDLLAGYGDSLRTVRRDDNGGFAVACNDGAAAAGGELLVFLNNDTVPFPGWLDALIDYSDEHPAAAVVGAKLLYPDGSIQHAGVVICQDGRPRHVYAGFPGDHPAVNVSRPFQAVTAACALVKRDAFEEVGGFDPGFPNALEDTDLCLRLGERGHEVHYCHTSVVQHLETVSRRRRSEAADASWRLFSERWGPRTRRDELDYYVADGLLRVHYRDGYPLGLEVSALLAFVQRDKGELERVLDEQSRRIARLLREVARLSVRFADTAVERLPQVEKPEPGRDGPPVDREAFLERAERLETEIYELQESLAAATRKPGSQSDATGLEASEQLGYRRLVAQCRSAAVSALPPGATVLVASRGDDELLELDGRQGWHFPQDEDGTYAGHYPTDGADAVAQLQALVARGADYLLLPATALWWLERYPELGEYLRKRAVVLEDERCLIVSLREENGDG
jgi:GT2 family glycosyltransferase